MPISFVLTRNPSTIRRVQTNFTTPELENLSVTTTSHSIGISDVDCQIFGCYSLVIQKNNQKIRTDSQLQVETKHTLAEAYIHDEKSLESFSPTSKNLTKTSPKDSGLLRIHSLLFTMCHRSTVCRLPSTSLTSKGEQNIINIF